MSNAERLFDWMSKTYGRQKVLSTYDVGGDTTAERDAGLADVVDHWERQISRFDDKTLRRAIQALIDGGKGWPPSLPEFVAMCRDFNRPESFSTAALPAPHGKMPSGVNLKSLVNRDQTDHLRWARKLGSLTAARYLTSPRCQDDPRLRDILREHERNGFAGIPTECANHLRAWCANHGEAV